ncbi:CLUMA_CG007484, isoform A [Clunio marinus]|uniref:CLUMA_CG007484, isoform A n=1 Tax=Clunio marinus TaxID=568069 RepID=A0A1J1I4X8_9DIPT|nr:CLUMA_CG007484, isoform A [Clunio marinus]
MRLCVLILFYFTAIALVEATGNNNWCRRKPTYVCRQKNCARVKKIEGVRFYCFGWRRNEECYRECDVTFTGIDNEKLICYIQDPLCPGTPPATEPPPPPATEPPPPPATDPPTLGATSPPCTSFPQYNQYLQALDDFEELQDKIAEAGEITPEIQEIFDDIADRLETLTEYLRDNCDNLVESIILDDLAYVRTRLTQLEVVVDAFISSLNPNTECPSSCPANRPERDEDDCGCICRLNCNVDGGNVIRNFAQCRCETFDVGVNIYEWDDQIKTLIDIIHKYQVTEVQVIITELWETYDIVEQKRGEIEQGFGTLTEAQITTIITTVTNLITEITTKVQTFVREQGSTVCFLTFCADEVILVESECTCKNNSQVVTFYGHFELFYALETEIYKYSGIGPVEELDDFKERTVIIRALFVELYDLLTTDYDVNEVLEDLDEILAIILQLREDFDNWVQANSLVCIIDSCEANEVANKRFGICACQVVNGWENLPGIKDDLLNNVITQINALVVVGDSKDILLNNLNLIVNDINDLLQYVVDFSQRLDMDYVRAKTLELNTWYNQLLEDYQRVVDGNQITECLIQSCLPRWVFNPEECKCSCSVGCNADQAIDYYNCQCAELNGCALEREDCDANTEALDYAACTCRLLP